MIQIDEKINMVSAFKNKNILVVGLARSGTGAANLLSKLEARVSITDRKPRSSLEHQINKLLPDVNVIDDGNPDEMIGPSDMIVISPGVPLDIPLLVKARMRGIPVIGELELAYLVIAGEALRVRGEEHETEPAAPDVIGITGTNGKSTTTTLIDLMLKDSGYSTLLGGNIGNALTEELLNAMSGQRSTPGKMPLTERCQINADYIVAEISSFQLESIREFRPRIGAVLNITPDHLDRYDSMKDYINAKARIFENQTSEDFLILNADDPLVRKMIDEKLIIRNKKMPKLLYFSREKEVDGIYCRDGMIYCNLRNKGVLPYTPARCELIGVDDIRIKGVHNLENAMAASLAALLSGCSNEAVKHTLRNFSGLEHRLEFVGEVMGVRFINDSKGTNVGAVAKSLEDFDNILLIMGGLDKGNDYSVLQDLIKRKVKLLILIGEAKEIIAKDVGAMTETHKVSNLREAVTLSLSKASPGDVVMLSPGCASFDMFLDFEDRGRKFKQAVRDIAHEY